MLPYSFRQASNVFNKDFKHGHLTSSTLETENMLVCIVMFWIVILIVTMWVWTFKRVTGSRPNCHFGDEYIIKWFVLLPLFRYIKGPFILHCNCVAVRMYQLLIFAASHCSITTFQVTVNLTFMRHHSAVTSHECAVQQRNVVLQCNCSCSVVWTDL